MSGRLLRTVCTAAALAAVAGTVPALGPTAVAVPAGGSRAHTAPAQEQATTGRVAGRRDEPGRPAGTQPPQDSWSAIGSTGPNAFGSASTGPDAFGAASTAPGTTDPGATGPGTTGPDSTGPDSTGIGTPEAGAGVAPGGAAPFGVPQALARLGTLYRQSDDAGTALQSAEARLRTQRAETARLGRALTRARESLAGSRGDAGRFARAQYRGRSELSAHLRLLLAPNARRALDEGYLMDRLAADRVATVARLEAGTRRAGALVAASRRALDRERALTARLRQARDTATRRLRAVEKMLASLSPAQIAALTSPESQDALLTPGALGTHTGDRTGAATADGRGGEGGDGTAPRHPTERGAAAVRYAVEQLGKPYVWGATGPDAYDCSGLTSRAWSRAGREIPRTSQEQWARLPRVPLRSLRPGDLVVYFAGATHVALYLGDGLVVQAPRPGAVVKVSPLAANPVLGAVRPDLGEAPLADYTPPRLPEGATAGPDTGYSADSAPAGAAAAATSAR
ncbi:NlpC/P60 family protein [Streptomyces sp. NPDC020965]|uniref:C40 family peptidase n=1 Tax=Streptomyces sp. NPDC020965 TaxID=3365105 RepID=UPI00379C9F60